MISAEVILGSTSPYAKPIYTLKTRYPWFIHGEVMTHRVFSRNASSNRAIPLAKMLEEVENSKLRAEPVFWGAEQKGMSPGDELPDYPPSGKYPFVSPKMEAQIAWSNAARAAADRARRLAAVGTHKSICNRLLMPFTHANVIITSTEWENFFGLRLDKAADPTMRALAEAMWVAINEYKTQSLQPYQWHLPFVNEEVGYNNAIKVSVARCARVSYESFETGKRSTIEEDYRLYDKLMGAQPVHASPAEHQAFPDMPSGKTWKTWKTPQLHGNFIGWVQYRKTLTNEAIAPLPKEYTWTNR